MSAQSAFSLARRGEIQIECGRLVRCMLKDQASPENVRIGVEWCMQALQEQRYPSTVPADVAQTFNQLMEKLRVHAQDEVANYLEEQRGAFMRCKLRESYTRDVNASVIRLLMHLARRPTVIPQRMVRSLRLLAERRKAQQAKQRLEAREQAYERRLLVELEMQQIVASTTWPWEEAWAQETHIEAEQAKAHEGGSDLEQQQRQSGAAAPSGDASLSEALARELRRHAPVPGAGGEENDNARAMRAADLSAAALHRRYQTQSDLPLPPPPWEANWTAGASDAMPAAQGYCKEMREDEDDEERVAEASQVALVQMAIQVLQGLRGEMVQIGEDGTIMLRSIATGHLSAGSIAGGLAHVIEVGTALQRLRGLVTVLQALAPPHSEKEVCEKVALAAHTASLDLVALFRISRSSGRDRSDRPDAGLHADVFGLVWWSLGLCLQQLLQEFEADLQEYEAEVCSRISVRVDPAGRAEGGRGGGEGGGGGGGARRGGGEGGGGGGTKIKGERGGERGGRERRRGGGKGERLEARRPETERGGRHGAGKGERLEARQRAEGGRGDTPPRLQHLNGSQGDLSSIRSSSSSRGVSIESGSPEEEYGQNVSVKAQDCCASAARAATATTAPGGGGGGARAAVAASLVQFELWLREKSAPVFMAHDLLHGCLQSVGERCSSTSSEPSRWASLAGEELLSCLATAMRSESLCSPGLAHGSSGLGHAGNQGSWLRELWVAALKPAVTAMEQWGTTGELQDPCNEFDGGVELSQSLGKPGQSSSCPLMLPLVRTSGQYMRSLRSWTSLGSGKDTRAHESLGVGTSCQQALKHREHIQPDVLMEAHVVLPLERMACRAARPLLVRILQDEQMGLLKHLAALRLVAFLEREEVVGPFMQRFFTYIDWQRDPGAGQGMSMPWGAISVKLNGALSEGLAAATSTQGSRMLKQLSKVLGARVQLSLSSSPGHGSQAGSRRSAAIPHGKLDFSHLQLSYAAPSPLDLVIDAEALQVLSSVMGLLLRIQYSQAKLLEIQRLPIIGLRGRRGWLMVGRGRGARGRMTSAADFRAFLHICDLLRSEIRHFLTCLESYLRTDVLQEGTKALEQRLKQMVEVRRDGSDVLSHSISGGDLLQHARMAHREYLLAIQTNAFLAPEMRAVLADLEHLIGSAGELHLVLQEMLDPLLAAATSSSPLEMSGEMSITEASQDSSCLDGVDLESPEAISALATAYKKVARMRRDLRGSLVYLHQVMQFSLARGRAPKMSLMCSLLNFSAFYYADDVSLQPQQADHA